MPLGVINRMLCIVSKSYFLATSHSVEAQLTSEGIMFPVSGYCFILFRFGVNSFPNVQSILAIQGILSYLAMVNLLKFTLTLSN